MLRSKGSSYLASVTSRYTAGTPAPGAAKTPAGEIIALSEAAKDMVYLRKLVRGLGEPEPGPSVLATDSQSARDVSYNPEHHGR